MADIESREVHLAARPNGFPTPDAFAIVRRDVRQPGAGQLLVRNLFMSLDPYMRGRMNAGKSYVPPWEVGQVLDGAAVGEVVESNAEGFSAGDIVTSRFGWREHFVAERDQVRRVDRSVRPVSAHLGVLGFPGFTAWVGLNLVGVKAGDRVFISGAAGAVGHIAGQLVKLRGGWVVGSAGSQEKVKVLTSELGFDAAFSYKNSDILEELHRAAPDGIDVYFDNVGGDHLEAAIAALRTHGRIAACGAISTYNDEKPVPGPRNLFQIVAKRLTIRGFIVGDSLEQLPAFESEAGRYLAAGELKGKETVVDGIEQAPSAFLDMMRGGNIGKMVVRLA